MRTIHLIVFCLLTLTAARGEDKLIKPAHATTPHHQPRWTGMADTIVSHSYTRLANSVKYKERFGLTSALINSEGTKAEIATFGWAPLSRRNGSNEALVDLQLGAVKTFGDKHKGEINKTGLVAGVRAVVATENFLLESWVHHVPGKLGWTNCEPFFDVFRRTWKNLHIGMASSCYVGFGKHHEAETVTTSASHHTEEIRKRHFQLFAGPGVQWKTESYNFGLSYEAGLVGGGKGYFAGFGNATFSFSGVARKLHLTKQH